MKTTITQHASQRMSQRGISLEVLELISLFGIEYTQHGHAAISFIDKKGLRELKNLRHEIDKLLKSNPIVKVSSTKNDRVITTYHQSHNKKVRHNG
ncbi:hypothetical protein A3750_22135 [Oleiphilus sp. HI0079]|nr:hypothetical protein A3750_13640 [Oleiphilus sp. HI0079]KZZ17641.1 hypothetical protein A3750_22135 [Oleiphilus sp. HI0079]